MLELAAGPGDTGFIAAKRLGPDGLLLSTDVAPEMVDAARRRAAELGVANVEFRVEDASAISLLDGAVDGVLCRLGIMLVPDPSRALAEIARVLRAGGACRNRGLGLRGRQRLDDGSWAVGVRARARGTA